MDPDILARLGKLHITQPNLGYEVGLNSADGPAFNYLLIPKGNVDLSGFCMKCHNIEIISMKARMDKLEARQHVSVGAGSWIDHYSCKDMHASGLKGCPLCAFVSAYFPFKICEISNRQRPHRSSKVRLRKGALNLSHGIDTPINIGQSYSLEWHSCCGDVESWKVCRPYDVEVPPQLNLRRLNIVPMVDNPAVYKFLELKMLECLTLHSDCEENDTSILPTRVIDVGPSDGSRSPFLYIPTKLAQGVQRGKYMALSYVWGPSKTAKTTMATLSTYRDKIPLSELPKTIRDAIFLARKLSIRYLWVDALCIIQSSSARPSTDWELESARMGEIYRKARVTLLASWASHSDDGIFVPSTSIGKACRVIADKASEDFAVIQKGATESDLQFVQTDCLSGRGWALQERYLSTRKAIFSENDVHWECNHDSKLTYDTDWTAIVEDYSKRKLSVSTDKLTALSGLAKALRGPDRGKYLAGLWEEELIPSLLWRMAKCSPRLGSPQVRKYIAPSWSWASVDGEVAFKLGSSTMPGSFQQKITIETNEIQLAGSDEYGQVKNGWLVVCGKIRELQDFDPLMNPSSSPFVITDGRIDSPADCMGSWENKHPHKAGLVWLDGEKTLSGGSKIFGVRYFVLRVAMWRMGAAGHICGLLLKTLPRSPYEYYRVGVFQLSHYAGEDWFSESATRRQIRIY